MSFQIKWKSRTSLRIPSPSTTTHSCCFSKTSPGLRPWSSALVEAWSWQVWQTPSYSLSSQWTWAAQKPPCGSDSLVRTWVMLLSFDLDLILWQHVKCWFSPSGRDPLPLDWPQPHRIQSLVSKGHQWLLCLPWHWRLLESYGVWAAAGRSHLPQTARWDKKK